MTNSRKLLLIAAAVFLVEMAFAPLYGYHRDELYFLAAGRHPAWGYVDQPPLTPMIARLSETLFGNSLYGLRLVPALIAAGTVVMAGLLAKELGGETQAQVLAAVAVAGSSLFLMLGHLLSTATIDAFIWVVILYLVTKILKGRDPRLWLLVGTGFGIGMLNKQTILMLAVSLFVGILAGRRLDLLLNRWLPLGVLLAGAIAIPNLIWQASHNWPQIEMAGAIRQENPQFPLSITMIAFLALTANPVIAPLWIGGQVRLLKSPATADLRPLGWTAVAAFSLLVLAGGQFYYPAPVLIPLIASGAIAAQRRLRLNEGKRFVRTVGIVAASSLIGAPIVLPILPLPVLAETPVGEVNPDALETVGWPELVETVASVYEGLSPEDRARTTLFTSNYGEAGSIERYGAAFDLPPPSSAHNNYWLWGPPPDEKDLVIAVGVPESTVSAICADGRLAARIESPDGIENDEDGLPVWVCSRMRATWKELWPSLRHYG